MGLSRVARRCSNILKMLSQKIEHYVSWAQGGPVRDISVHCLSGTLLLVLWYDMYILLTWDIEAF